MNLEYQKKVIKETERFRVKARYPVYPPYHDGYYIEEYFYNYFQRIDSDRIYIPIYWTNLYCNETHNGEHFDIQTYLDSLDTNLKYFTVCQHEAAPIEKLPNNTLIFSASGKIHQDNKSNNHISIPLLCSKIKNPKLNKKRDIFCSFVGAKTHRVRESIYNTYRNDDDFYISMEPWSPDVPKHKEDEFKDITERSIFALCPRGDGPTSFRLYETMQLGAIPIYVYDMKWIPYENDINWNDICVFIHESEIPHMKDILKNISKERIEYMRIKIKELYNEWFSMDGMSKHITNRLKNEKMRLLTCYSESHRTLFENYFNPSVKKINQYEIISQKYEQIGDGSFMNIGWKDSTFRKIDFLIQMVEECWGECFLFSDSDIIFLNKTKDFLLEQLGSHDACFQRDFNDLCSGFFIMKANDKTLKFLKNCIINKNKYPEDQTAFRGEKEAIDYILLPDQIFNIGMINGGTVWDGEPIDIPKNILVFHANWTIGTKAKVDLFNLVIDNFSRTKDFSILDHKNDSVSYHRFNDGSIFVGKVQSGRMINGIYLKEDSDILSPDNKNSNKKLKVNVYYNYFRTKKEPRNDELKYCLNRLIANEKIDRLYLLCSDKYTESTTNKVIKIDMLDTQPTFNDIFNIVNFNTKDGDLNILINSDCFIDEKNVDLILNNIKQNMVYCLSRWNITKLKPFKSEHYDLECSQDAWIFLGSMKNTNCDFKMGMPGCDNAVAYEFKNSEYEVSNPSMDIKIYHYHLSDTRTYGVSHEEKESNRIRRPYIFIPSSHINEQVEIKKVLFEGVKESKPSCFNSFVNQSYVINLKRREDRLKHMRKEFNKIGLSFKIFNAIDGRKLGNDLKSSQIAILRSHVGVISDALRMGYQKIALFEDDIIFCDDFESRFENYIKNVPSDWDIMYLGAHFNDCKSPTLINNYIYKVDECYMCCAMILNNKNKLFENIIEITKNESKPIDNYYHDDILKLFKGYIFMPTFVKTWNTTSDASLNKNSSTNIEVDKHFKNVLNDTTIHTKQMEIVKQNMPHSQPKLDYVKSNQEICEDFVYGNLPFQIYHGGRLLFDSDTSDKLNLFFARDYFTLYGRQFSYQSMMIKRK